MNTRPCIQPCFTRKQDSSLSILVYLLTLATFLLTIPREWHHVTRQNSPHEDHALLARLFATDSRFKTASFTALSAVTLVCYRLLYPSAAAAAAGRCSSSPLLETPLHFILGLLLLGLKVGYAVAAAFAWSVSPVRYGVSASYLFGLGYTPALLLVLLFNILGFFCDDHLLVSAYASVGDASPEEEDENRRSRMWPRASKRRRARVSVRPVQSAAGHVPPSDVELRPLHRRPDGLVPDPHSHTSFHSSVADTDTLRASSDATLTAVQSIQDTQSR